MQKLRHSQATLDHMASKWHMLGARMRVSSKGHLKQPWRFKEGIPEKLTSGLKPGKWVELARPEKGPKREEEGAGMAGRSKCLGAGEGGGVTSPA